VIYARGWCVICINEECMFIPDGQIWRGLGLFATYKPSIRVHHDMIEARVLLFLRNFLNR